MAGGIALLLASLVGCSGSGDGDTGTTGAAASAPATTAATSAPATATDDGHADDGHTDDAAAATTDGSAGGALALTLTAVDAVDGAGFHGMAEELETATEVNPRWASKVNDVLTMVRAVPWDESLAHDVEGLVTALEAFHEGLEAADVAAALEGAQAIHEAQHHFSPNVYAWVAGQHTDHDDEGALLVTSLAAIDIVDSAGFHGMIEDIQERQEIPGRYARATGNALAAINAAAWPHDIEENVSAIAEALEAAVAAMEAGDVDAAVAAIDAVHEQQHDFSGGYYAWLTAQHGAIDHSDPLVARACLLKSVDMIGALGLHGLSEGLETATELNPRDGRGVAKMVAVFEGAVHHGPAAAETMHQQLTALQQAYASDDLDGARAAAHDAHEAQHDFGHDAMALVAEDVALMVVSGGHSHDDGGHDAADAADLGTAEPDLRLAVEMANFSYAPQTITVGAGQVVELTVENSVAVLHDMTIDELPGDVDVAEAAGHSHGAVGGGAEHAAFHVGMEEIGTQVIRFRVDEPGEYIFYCTVPGHRDLGMEGTLVVTQ